MSIIGVINSDKEMNKLIETELSSIDLSGEVITSHIDTHEILEYLNFDMPEIVIMNLCDKNINIDYIIKQIIADTWLHNFGIIGLFDKNIYDEKKLMAKLKKINLLNLFEYLKIKVNLSKSINIILTNRQIIFQREISDKLVEKISGSFEIDSNLLAVPSYTNLIAIYLYNQGYVDDEMKINTNIALSELIINGIEHGNCRITYREKAEYIQNGGSIQELINEKCKNPVVAKKRVILEYEILPDHSILKVRDEGDGFDVKRYQEWIQKKNPYSLLGRGILMARGFSKKLSYNHKGNEATLTIEHKDIPIQSPAGFSDQKAVHFKKNDIIFREGEESNFIYYILSGKYGVFHKNKKIGYITPADIFMGEMSFLLNNQRSATVKTEKEGKLLKISKKQFISVIKKYPHYGIFLSRLIARKLARTNTATARMMLKIAEYDREI
jgi:hypothetical protein